MSDVPLSEAVTMVQGLSTGGSDILEATKWVVVILLMVAGACLPFMMLINKKTKDKNTNVLETAISEVGSTLYTQLSKQVEEYRLAADSASKERNELVLRVAHLEAQIFSLESLRETNERLRSKLDVKDEEMKGLLAQGLDERKQFMDMLLLKNRDSLRRDAKQETPI